MAAKPTPESKAPNLAEQLDEVISYLAEFREFANTLWRKCVISFSIRKPTSFTLGMLRLRFSPGRDVLSDKRTAFGKELFALASDEAKKSDFFPICVNDYSIHSLSLKLLSRYSAYDFKKLADLHGSFEREFIVFKGLQVVAFAIAAASFLLREVPKEVVQDQLGIRYTNFEIVVFWTGFISAVYVSWIFFPSWLIVLAAKNKHRFIGSVLEYTALIQAIDS